MMINALAKDGYAIHYCSECGSTLMSSYCAICDPDIQYKGKPKVDAIKKRVVRNTNQSRAEAEKRLGRKLVRYEEVLSDGKILYNKILIDHFF